MGMGEGASGERERKERKRGERVKQKSLELRANYCSCNLDSKHRDMAVTGSHRQPWKRTHIHARTKQTKDGVCARPYISTWCVDCSVKLQMYMHFECVCLCPFFPTEWHCRSQPANQLLYSCQFNNISER